MSDPASTVGDMDELTDLERKILAFEGRRWNHQGAKDTEVLRTFQLSPVRYQQYVLTIIDKPAAYAAEPVLVKRLRRLRETRRRQRIR